MRLSEKRMREFAPDNVSTYQNPTTASRESVAAGHLHDDFGMMPGPFSSTSHINFYVAADSVMMRQGP